jgi:Cell division protein ZapA
MEPIQITLTLFNRPFKIKVLPHSEQALRNAVKQMNDNMETYKKGFPGRDDFDYLAMAVMTLISSEPEIKNRETTEDVIASLQKVEEMLG